MDKHPTVVVGGIFDGYRISKARKCGRCQCRNRICERWIEVGDLYISYGNDPDAAGGFGAYRVCLACAGIDETGRAIEETK